MAAKKKKAPKQVIPPAVLPTAETAQEYIDFAKQFSNEKGVAGQVLPGKPVEPTAEEKTQSENLAAAQTRRDFVLSNSWTDYIKSNYPALLAIYNSTPEIAEIIKNGYINQETPTDIATKIRNSKWSNGLQSGEYEYIVGGATDNRQFKDKVTEYEDQVRTVARDNGYTLSEESIKIIAADAFKGTWDANKIASQARMYVVEEAKKGAPVVGTTPPAEAPTTGLQRGQDAATIRSVAESYGIKLTDTQVEGYVQASLNQTLSAQQIKDQFRNQAKSLYPSISNQLDSGTLDDATSSYRSIASTVLGIDSTSIDFSDPNKFGKLLTYKDPQNNESRLMNATEWNNFLRGLPEWQKTSEASTKYDSMIKTIDNLFQKVR